jgi:HSP20 family molecular chaperone IbpA
MSKAVTEFGSAASQPAVSKIEELFDEASRLSDQIARRAYELYKSRGGDDGHDKEDWLRAEAELLTPMPIEMLETNDTILLKAKAPGFTAKNIRIGVEPRRCVIAGHSKGEEHRSKGQAQTRDRNEKRICRLIELPDEVRPDASVFNLQEGILELTLRRVHKSAPGVQ